MDGIKFKKVLGGPANGCDVPAEWDGFLDKEWHSPGSDIPFKYSRRQYFRGDLEDTIWVPQGLDDRIAQEVLQWHIASRLNEMWEAQKALLADAHGAAERTLNVVMLVGYAAIFAFWSQMRDEFDDSAIALSGLLLLVSVAFFVGWEVFAMVRRNINHIRIGYASSEETTFMERIVSYKGQQEAFTRRTAIVWTLSLAISVAFAIGAGSILGYEFLVMLWDLR